MFTMYKYFISITYYKSNVITEYSIKINFRRLSMKYILNLTGVPATPEQVFDGVIELANDELKERLVYALSFDKVPLFKEVEERAELIEDIFVEDTEIRTGLKLKELSVDSGKEIPMWSKLKEMDIGVMLNTDTFMVDRKSVV
mgnify:CR=1 FL=1